MKSLAVRAEIGSHEEPPVLTEMPSREARDVRVEDLGDGSALISLRLPWPIVLQVLDLATTSAPTPSATHA